MSQSIPPAALATIPAGPPPPGVTPNLINPPTINGVFFGINIPIMVLVILFVGLRIKSRLSGYGKFGLGDYSCILGAIITLAVFADYIFLVTVCKYGTHIWDVPASLIASRKFAIADWLSSWPTNPAYLLVKNTFFIMFMEIFTPFFWMKVASWIGIIVTTLCYIIVMIIQLVTETPSDGHTWENAFSEPKYTISEHLSIPTAAIGLAIDMYILVLPLIAISRLQMSRKKKLAVGAVFATGLGAVVASALGVYYRTELTKKVKTDLTRAVFPVYVVNLVELGVGIIVSCMPACAGLLRGNSHILELIRDIALTSLERLRISTGRSRTSRSETSAEEPQEPNQIHRRRSFGVRYSSELFSTKASNEEEFMMHHTTTTADAPGTLTVSVHNSVP